jgi:hypothetical protein
MDKREGKSSGPAFPLPIGLSEDSWRQGMSLRDYFAAKAMQGLLANGDGGDPVEDVSDYAYQIADAMLKAREK